MQTTIGRACSIGRALAPRITPEGLKVVSVFEGSPAAAAGISPGDTILAINGHTGRQLNAPFLFYILRQPVGTIVRPQDSACRGREKRTTQATRPAMRSIKMPSVRESRAENHRRFPKVGGQ